MKSFFFGIAILIATNALVFSKEYIYPVSSFVNQIGEYRLLLLHQKSNRSTELWVWNPKTKMAFKALYSVFSPLNVKMLPNKKGFSFFDDGRLRIKLFEKRSPQSLDFYDSIYHVGVIRWATDFICYFSAKQRGYYSIFSLDIYDTITPLIQSEDSDFLFPILTETSMFCVERKLFNSVYYYRVVFFSINRLTHESIIIQEKKVVLTPFQKESIAFLEMISDEQGFFVEYTSILPTNTFTQDVLFSYYSIEKKKTSGGWKTKKLFVFSIPLNMFTSHFDNALSESLLPLLPHYYNNGKIYYTNKTSNNTLNIFSFSFKTNESTQITSVKPGTILCTPIKTHANFYCGGEVTSKKNALPKIEYLTSSQAHISLLTLYS